MKRILIAGASGMVGTHLLNLCLESEDVEKVISLVRKPSTIQSDKLEEIIQPDFEQYDPAADYLQDIDVAFFCIGVYTGAASKEVFRKITVNYPVALAKALKVSAPKLRFCLLSGAGADRSGKSKMIFARDKGAAENQLADLQLGSFHAFRPAYIYPVVKRKEPNLMYRLSRRLYPIIRLFGNNASITSLDLAKGMFKVGMGTAAAEILENKDILDLL